MCEVCTEAVQLRSTLNAANAVKAVKAANAANAANAVKAVKAVKAANAAAFTAWTFGSFHSFHSFHSFRSFHSFHSFHSLGVLTRPSWVHNVLLQHRFLRFLGNRFPWKCNSHPTNLVLVCRLPRLSSSACFSCTTYKGKQTPWEISKIIQNA